MWCFINLFFYAKTIYKTKKMMYNQIKTKQNKEKQN